MRFLIAEDNEQDRGLLEKMLSGYGEYDIAGNGQQAYQMFETAHQEGNSYDLIFLDIMMPQIAGDQVLVMIREWENKYLEEGNPVQIVMATSKTDADTIFDSYDQDCQHFIMKPYVKFDIEEVMVTMGFKLSEDQ
jgi:two-component system chemotaxis response regulator CheY